ncbi:MAG: TonB family protein [Bryobacterales bacterium]|jgi:protein TonB|nr:TonB family protein [Bryobacterales bacterium]
MYEAITGKRPFTADSMTTLIFKIVSDEPDPKRDNPQLSDAVSAVLKRALAKNPDDRFPNCMALAQAFRDAAGLGGAESPGTLRNPAMGRDSLTGTQSLPGGAGGYGSGSVAMPPPSMTGTPSGAYPNTGMPLPPPAGTASVATPMATPIATPISTQTRAPMSTRTPTPGLIPRPDATPASTPLPPVPPMGGPATRTTAGIPPGAGLSQPTWQPSARQATEAPNVSQSAWASTPSAYTPTPVPRKNLWLAPLLVVLGLVLVGGIFGLFRLLRTSPENDDKDKRAAGVVTPVNQGADAALPGGPGNAANGFTANSGSTDTPSVRPAMDAQTGGGTNPTGQPVASNSAVKLPQPPGSSSRPAAPPNGGYPTTSTPPTTAGGTMRPGGSPAAVVKPPAVASPKSPAATKPAGLPGTGGSPATSRSPEGAASPVPGTPVPGAAVPGAAVPATGPGSPNSGSSNPGASPVDANRTPGSAVPAVTTAPRPTLRVPAVYPAAARREGVSGTVGLRALVGVDGVPRNIEVTKGIRSDLDKAASDALARWRFQPGTVDGKPTEARVNVEITFNLVQDSRKPVSLRNE